LTESEKFWKKAGIQKAPFLIEEGVYVTDPPLIFQVISRPVGFGTVKSKALFALRLLGFAGPIPSTTLDKRYIESFRI